MTTTPASRVKVTGTNSKSLTNLTLIWWAMSTWELPRSSISNLQKILFLNIQVQLVQFPENNLDMILLQWWLSQSSSSLCKVEIDLRLAMATATGLTTREDSLIIVEIVESVTTVAWDLWIVVPVIYLTVIITDSESHEWWHQ